MLWIHISIYWTSPIVKTRMMAHQDLHHSLSGSMMGWSTLPEWYRWAALTFALHVWQSAVKHMACRQRRCSCKVGKSSAKQRATVVLYEVTPVAAWHLQGDDVGDTGKNRALCFPAQREGHAVRMTFTPLHHKTTAAPPKTNNLNTNYSSEQTPRAYPNTFYVFDAHRLGLWWFWLWTRFKAELKID